MSISPLEFYNAIAENDIDFVTGVPDSLLKELCACIDDKLPKDRHIIAANEGNAVAIAAGYHLATGKIPLVYMQNSGLGNAINPLLSLCDREIYSIPMIVIVGWRGEPGTDDAIQHVKDGRIQLDLLEAVELPYEIISKGDTNFKEKIHQVIKRATKESRPIILLVRKGVFSQYSIKLPKMESTLMTREEALKIILESLNEKSVIVATTGKTSREIYEIRNMLNQPHHSSFLTVGSMGHCSSIALGISLAQPDKEVFCVDGDGALIMHMGSLATVGMTKPKNFKHILINNKVHESVGGQHTAAAFINIPELAKANGYKTIFTVDDKSQLKDILPLFIDSKGPSFLELFTQPGSRNDLGRPKNNLTDYKKIFMKYIKN